MKLFLCVLFPGCKDLLKSALPWLLHVLLSQRFLYSRRTHSTHNQNTQTRHAYSEYPHANRSFLSCYKSYNPANFAPVNLQALIAYENPLFSKNNNIHEVFATLIDPNIFQNLQQFMHDVFL